MKNLPRRFRDFKKHFARLREEISLLYDKVKDERRKKEPLLERKKRKELWLYPFVITVSAILILMGLEFSTGSIAYIFLGTAFFIHPIYWSAYFVSLRRALTLGKYASSTFNFVHTFILGTVEATYRFSATGNILVPAAIRLNGLRKIGIQKTT
jgi:hypothetical protein